MEIGRYALEIRQHRSDKVTDYIANNEGVHESERIVYSIRCKRLSEENNRF